MPQPLTETQNEAAARIIANAFIQYPLMLHAFEGLTEQQRKVRLQRLFTHCVAASELYGGILVTPDKQGAVIWLRGSNFPLGLVREIRSGMWLIPLVCGIKPTLRLVAHDAEPEGWIKKSSGPDFGYIWNIGVLPEARGKGLSRLLIDQSIAQMKQAGLGECWLKTEDAKNVAIYEKLGFKAVNEIVVKSSGITSWAMWRTI